MYSLFRRSTLMRKGFQSSEQKTDLILNSYEDMEVKPSLLEGDHEDMSNMLYSFHNGLVYLRQVDCPSRKYPVAPDGEIPNSVVRRKRIVKEVIEEQPKDKLMCGVWRTERPIDIDAAQLGESLVSVIDPSIITESLDEIRARSEELAAYDHEKVEDKAETFPNLAVPGWQNTKLYKLCNALFMESNFKLNMDADWNAVFDCLLNMLESKEFPVFSTACKYLVELNNCHAISEEYRMEVAIRLYAKLKPKQDPNITILALKTIGAMDLRREQDYGLIKDNIESNDIDIAIAALELKKLFNIPDDLKVESKPKTETPVRIRPRQPLTGEAGRLQKMTRGIEQPKIPKTTMKEKTKAEDRSPKPDQKPEKTETKVAKEEKKKKPAEDKDVVLTKVVQKPRKEKVVILEKQEVEPFVVKKGEEEKEEKDKEEETDSEKIGKEFDEDIFALEELEKSIPIELEQLREKAKYERLSEEEASKFAKLGKQLAKIVQVLNLKRKKMRLEKDKLEMEDRERLAREKLAMEDKEGLTEGELTKEDKERLAKEKRMLGEKKLSVGKKRLTKSKLTMEDKQRLAKEKRLSGDKGRLARQKLALKDKERLTKGKDIKGLSSKAHILSESEFASLTKEEAEELMRQAADELMRDVSGIAPEGDELADKKFENLTAEEIERLMYLDEDLRDETWKEALTPLSALQREYASELQQGDDMTFHHPTDIARKLSHSKQFIPNQMYKINKVLKRKAHQRGEDSPKQKEIVEKPPEKITPSKPSIPTYEAKKVPGYLVSDAFKKPDKSQEKFFKRSSLSSRAAPTATQRLVAHLEDPGKIHRKCFEVEGVENLPTVLLAHDIASPVMGETMSLTKMSSQWWEEEPILVVVEDYKEPDISSSAPEVMQQSTDVPIGEEEPGEQWDATDQDRSVPDEKEVAAAEGEGREGGVEGEGRKKGEEKEMVVGDEEGPAKKGEIAEGEEGEEKEMVVGEEEGLAKKGEIAEGEEGEEKEMVVGDEEGLAKKGEIAEGEVKEMVVGEEEAKPKRVMILPRPEIPSTSEKGKPKPKSTSAPDIAEGIEVTIDADKAESVPMMKEIDGLMPLILPTKVPKGAAQEETLGKKTKKTKGAGPQIEEEPLGKKEIEAKDKVEPGAAPQIEEEPLGKKEIEAKDKVEPEMEKIESLMLSQKPIYSKGSLSMEPLEDTSEYLTESEIELCKLIKSEGSKVAAMKPKHPKIASELKTKEERREAALIDARWAKESEQVVPALDEKAMAYERHRIRSEQIENPMFETIERSIPALANIRLATLSDKPLKKEYELTPNIPKMKRSGTKFGTVPLGSLTTSSLKEKFLPIAEDKHYSDKEWQQLIAEKREQLLKKQLELERKKEMKQMSKKEISGEEEESDEEDGEEALRLEEQLIAESLSELGAALTQKDRKKIEDDQYLFAMEEQQIKKTVETSEKLIASEGDAVDQPMSLIKATTVPSVDYHKVNKAQHELRHKRAIDRLKYIDDIQLAPMSNELYKVTWEKSIGGVKDYKDKLTLPRIKYLVKSSPKRAFMSIRRESFTLYGKELYPPLEDDMLFNPQRETKLLIEREKIFSKRIKKSLPGTMKKYRDMIEDTSQAKHPTEVVGHIKYTKCLPEIKDSVKTIDSKSTVKYEFKQPQRIPAGLQYHNLFLSEKFNAYRRQSDYLAQKSQKQSFLKYSKPEWYPEDKKLMYSPNYYQQPEKTPEDHRRPHSTIY